MAIAFDRQWSEWRNCFGENGLAEIGDRRRSNREMLPCRRREQIGTRS